MLGGLVSGVILLPLLGALSQLLLRQPQSHFVAVVSSAMSSLTAIALLVLKFVSPEFTPGDHSRWIELFSIDYMVEIDGLAVIPLLLTQIVCPVVLFSEREKKDGLRGYSALVLLIQSALMGMSCSKDLFLLFTFWSFTAFPVFFLTSIWGSAERTRASLGYFGLSLLGIGLALMGVLLTFQSTENARFAIDELAKGAHSGNALRLPFFLIMAGFLLRLPAFPLQAWYHRVVSTSIPSVSILISGAIVPVSLAALGRVLLPIFHAEIADYAMILLGYGSIHFVAFGISAGSRARMVELLSDFSGIGTGIFIVGVASLKFAGVAGAYVSMLSVGLSITVLGLVAMFLSQKLRSDSIMDGVDEESGSRETPLILTSPTFGFVGGLGFLSSVGFPGLLGFVSYAMVFVGLHAVDLVWPIVLFVSFVLFGYAMFRAFRSIYLAQSPYAGKKLELTRAETLLFVPPFVALAVIGIFPKFILDLIKMQFEVLARVFNP